MRLTKQISLGALFVVWAASAWANNTPQSLPFVQDWSNTGLITTNDDWSGVPGIVGFRGDGLTAANGTDPQTITAESTVIDVIANQSTPDTSTTGGVGEFDGIANPVVALQGSSTAAAPYLQLHLNTTGKQNIRVRYTLRDIDGSADNAVQPVALQYRVGTTGNFTNVPAGFVADATTGPSAVFLTTRVEVMLPSAAENIPVLQIRFIVSNAAGSDEWVGIDNISVDAPLMVRIRDIQGASHISPLNGQAVANVPGIVTAVLATSFFMQDPTPDGDPATSEGLLVFTGTAPTIGIGDSVVVGGTVVEFRPGGSASANLSVTEITSATVSVQFTGNALPSPVVIGVGGRVPPAGVIEDDAMGNVETSGVFDPATDGIDFYESLEGMRVQVNNAVVVGPTVSFGTIAELAVVGDNGSQAGLRTARGGLIARATDFNPERIIVTDAVANIPNAKVSDQFNGPIIGVIDYDVSGGFKLRATSPRPALIVVPLSQGSTTLAASALRLTLATMNLQLLTAGDAPAKFAGLAGLIVNNLASPSILCADGVLDDSGFTDDGVVSSDTTLNQLVAAITAAGGPSYSFRYISPVNNQDGGAPGGNVRQVLLYRADVVSFVDKPGGTATAGNTALAGPALQFSPGRIDPSNSAFSNNRKSLAAEFMFRGQRVIVIANQFNTRGGDDSLFGKNQPPTLGSESQRLQSVQVVKGFVQSLLAAGTNAAIVTAGNFNDFEFSNTLTALESAPLINLVKSLAANDRYTYNFQGNSETFHHILVSQNLAPVARIEAVHTSSEYAAADRFTDYDPLVALILAGPPATFAEWQSLHFTAQELSDSAVSGFFADPDSDAKDNELEAALGSDPRLGSTGNDAAVSAAWVGMGSDRRLALRFDMPSAALTDLTLAVEESASLSPSSWSTIATKAGAASWTGPATVTVTPVSANTVQVEVQSLQNLSAGRTFLYLKVQH